MRKAKRFLSFLVILALCLTFSISAMAEDETDETAEEVIAEETVVDESAGTISIEAQSAEDDAEEPESAADEDIVDEDDSISTADEDSVSDASVIETVSLDVSETAIGGGPSGGPGGEGAPGGDGTPGGSTSSYTEGDAATDLESMTYSGIVFPTSTGTNEAGVRAGSGVVAVLENCTINKTAGDVTGDAASFYGTNSGVHTYQDANLTITGSTIYTSSTGANGVFAYGDSTITISDSTVTTTGSGSGGIMVAGGGTIYATNLYVTTEGGSSAAIRSDRGGGTMIVNYGTYISNGSSGTGSPAVYCVADITVSNATLIAKNAQAFCFEGRNPGKVYNCYLEGNYTASDDDEASNVMIYQSMSGDSEEGTSYFTMVGGVLKAVNSKNLTNYKMFYTTNTYCYISLYDVTMVYPDTYYAFLLCACNTNQRGWGTAGANGSECVLYCIDQEILGDIIYDTWSYLDCYFTDGSEATTAFIMRENNGSRGCSVYLDASSTVILTADSVVKNLYTGGSVIVDENGATVTIVSSSGSVYVQGTSSLTLTVTGTYSETDKSAQSNVANIGTETNYTFNPEAIMASYFDASYDPLAVAGIDSDSNGADDTNSGGNTSTLGDVNGDGDINAVDVRLLFLYANKQASDSDVVASALDVDANGSVDVTDVRVLFQYVNKQTSDLSV